MHGESTAMQAVMDGEIYTASPWDLALDWSLKRIAECTPKAAEDGRPAPFKQQPILYRDLRNKVFPRREWLIKGMLEQGKFFSIIGQAKAAKTFWEIEMALAISAGKHAAEQEDMECQCPGPVYMFCAEDAEENMRDRIGALVAAHVKSGHYSDADAERIGENLCTLSSQRVDLMDPMQFATFVATIRLSTPTPRCIFIDPFVDVVSMESENDSREMNEGCERFRTLRDVFGCSVVVVHHAKKMTTGGKMRDVDVSRGSNVFMGKLDGWLTMTNVEASTQSIASDFSVRLKNGRRAPPMRMTLTLEDDNFGRAVSGAWTIEAQAEDAFHSGKRPPDSIRNSIMKVLGEGPCSTSLLKAKLRIRREFIQEETRKLEADGLIQKTGVGSRSAWQIVPQHGPASETRPRHVD